MDWPQCASPAVILALYWLLATETRFYFIKVRTQLRESHLAYTEYKLSCSKHRATCIDLFVNSFYLSENSENAKYCEIKGITAKTIDSIVETNW